MRWWTRRSGGGIALSAMLLLAGAARGGFTDPLLSLAEAHAAAGTRHVVVQLLGSFHGRDAVQIPFPLQVVVRDAAGGDAFLRYDLVQGGFSGRLPSLADGLDPEDALLLAAQGEAEPQARILSLEGGRLDLTVPASFVPRQAEVQLFAIQEGTVVLSNPLPLALPPLRSGP